MPSALSVLTLAHVFPRTLDDSMGAFLLHLLDALAARGIHSYVVAPHAAGLDDEETIGLVRVRRFHYAPANAERLAYAGTMHEMVLRGGIGNKLLFVSFIFAFLMRTLGTIRSARPRILHAHWWLPDGLVGAIASSLSHVPLVITTHGTDVEMLRRNGWTKPLAGWVFGRARVVTCGSNYLRDRLVALGVVDPARVSVIPMPVNALFETVAVEGNDARHDLLTVARLTEQKSLDTLINAVGLLRDRACAPRLTIIGDGPARGRLEQQVRELGLANSVEFLGERTQQELAPYYARCAAFVLPSVREGMGLVLAEALLCGAPVIAADSGGVTDIVQDGKTGLLVPARDPEKLAQAIERLLTERALAQRLAANGRARVQERYTREPVAQQFVEVYQRIL